MGVSVLVLGQSGSGKSTSLRNFEPGEIGILNVASKPLPFRKKLAVSNHPSYGLISATLGKNSLRAYCIDDANYLMAFENFAKVKQTGYGKFTDMALNFERLLEAANSTSPDTIVYFFMHPDIDDSGRWKPKTIGKMLDNQLCVEGMFPIVLIAERAEGEYVFRTETDGNTPAKAPMGLFDSPTIPNDLKAVDTAVRDYWGMKPIIDSPEPKDKTNKQQVEKEN